ncbi:MAG: hypothetical protein IIB03_00975 [Acidobacteria bacterium]|nr:hypothetical protein [Acidobacteriota bacterium]
MTYSFLDLAEEVLKSVTNPMTYQQVWDSAKNAGLNSKVKTKGKTPWHTMGAQLYVDVRDNPDSRFIKVGKRPARFFLRKRQDELSEALLQKIEIEVRNSEEISEALSSGADILLLDNMTPEQVHEAVEMVKGRCLIEVSGGVDESNIVQYAEAGADFVSSGVLTHSSPSSDLSLILEIQ